MQKCGTEALGMCSNKTRTPAGFGRGCSPLRRHSCNQLLAAPRLKPCHCDRLLQRHAPGRLCVQRLVRVVQGCLHLVCCLLDGVQLKLVLHIPAGQKYTVKAAPRNELVAFWRAKQSCKLRLTPTGALLGVCAVAANREGRGAPFLEGGGSEPGLAQLCIILCDLQACCTAQHIATAVQSALLLWLEQSMHARCQLLQSSCWDSISLVCRAVAVAVAALFAPHLCVGHHIQAEEVVLQLCQTGLIARNLSTQQGNLQDTPAAADSSSTNVCTAQPQRARVQHLTAQGS